MKTRLKYSVLFALLGAVFYLPFLGGIHLFDWDEINFAEIAREMIVTKDYLSIQIDFQPFFEKPPLFMWLQALSMHLFGINEYGARFPNAICGIITLMMVYNLGYRLYNTTFGIAWAGIYLGSTLPHLYFKSGIIDPYFNLFIFSGLYFFILFIWKKERLPGIPLNQNKIAYLLLSGFFTGLAILTKGPVAYLISALCIAAYWVLRKFKTPVGLFHFLIFTLVAFAVPLTWFGTEYVLHGPQFIVEFIQYQYNLLIAPGAGHSGFFGYHFVVLLLGCFPASVFCIRALFSVEQERQHQKDFRLWMIVLLAVVLIVFSIVKSKIIHYSSLAYFPVTYLAAISVVQIMEGKISFSRWMKAGLVFIALIFGFAFIAAPFIGKHIEALESFLNNDPFAAASLNADVTWTGWESVSGVLILSITVVAIFFISGNNKRAGFKILFGGTAVFVMLSLLLYVKKIEAYSQNAAITFFEKLQDKDVYVATWGYKSYAQLFYTRKPPPENPKSYDKNWLLNGDIDKDVYFITKMDKEKELSARADIIKTGEKNGFVFFLRKKNN